MYGLIALGFAVVTIWLCVLNNAVKNQEKLISHLQKQLNELSGNTDESRRDSAAPERTRISTGNVPEDTAAPPAIRTVRYDYSPKKEPSAKKEQSSMENWLGRNVLGIAASALIFIGLIFLGILIYDYLTEMTKLIIMYSISVLLTGLGIFFTLKKRNAFTVILTGCGCGSLFISILLTHIYFNYIGDITAFSLLAVWMAAALYLAKRLDSLLVSVTAHIGMIFSVCFAFATGMNDGKIAVVLIYQAVSTAVILLGNILCFKKTYRFGLVISLFLSVTASFFMTSRFSWGTPDGVSPFPATSIPAAALSAAFAGQFICASFLSYLLAVSSSRLKSGTAMISVHIINKLLWAAALSVNITHTAYRIAYCSLNYTFQIRYDAMFASVGISLVLLIIHVVISIVMSRKLNFSSALETISVLLAALTAGIMFLVLWSKGQSLAETAMPCLTGLIIIAVMLIAAGRIRRNGAYKTGGNIFIAADLLFMLAGGYRELETFGTIALPLCYLIIYPAAIWIQWILENNEERAKLLNAVRFSSLIVSEISLTAVFLSSSIQYKGTMLLLTLTVLNCLLYLFKYDYTGGVAQTPLKILLTASEIILVAVNSFAISFITKTPALTIMYFFLAVFTLCLAFLRIGPVLRGEGGTARELMAGVKITVIVLAVINGNTHWFDYAYILSLVCMLTALMCIVAGFAARAKTLRLYGLILTLVCVLKLVTADASGLNTVLRVVSLIGGGVICFIISALYNYSVKKFQSQGGENHNGSAGQ